MKLEGPKFKENHEAGTAESATGPALNHQRQFRYFVLYLHDFFDYLYQVVHHGFGYL